MKGVLMWILVVLYTSGAGNLAITTQEFATSMACSNAATLVTAYKSKMRGATQIETFCTPK